MQRIPHIDKLLLILIVLLLASGVFMFASASFGLLARGMENLPSVAFNHIVLGLGLGLLALIVASIVDHKKWRRFAPYIYALSLIATALVFVPDLGIAHGGGRRWLDIFGLSFQPSEALKLGTIIMAAAYFSVFRGRLYSMRHSLGGFLVLIALPAVLLFLQPDIGTFGVIFIATFAVYIAAGPPWKHVIAILCIVPIALGVLIMAKPYAKERILTFINPSQNQQAEGYQIKQSLIAIGSGALTGRGFGQGVQKFTYLPEPMGDSIFAVAAEEFGFIGSVALVLLFLLFALRGFSVAARAPDVFGGLLGIGIATYLGSEAFINIAAMLGLVPITGIPLTFISQGGSAMLVSLASAGILLNISRRAKN
ncbi:MAG: Stage V sporulation protein E (Required for spore cortex synthesis) [Parcubacteria group bacterium GW2011_GWA2_51_10]|nr:MAG: Stage V sporulation protein E (Required for spore cortex synthesis) [Parcubacteria group bacterium GW2011_GWA2_51_10]